MRLATFNIESLDDPSRPAGLLGRRIEVLRPQIERLSADVLCLQEVNAQHVAGARDRVLAALDRLVAGTRYAGYGRAASHGAPGGGLSDVHNLVVLSRLPIVSARDLRHELVPPIAFRAAAGHEPSGDADPVTFDRPALVVEIEVGARRPLVIFNVHLRAQRAAALIGRKLDHRRWATTAGWAEGLFVASLKRDAQALEVRLAVDRLLDEDAGRAIAVIGDLNAVPGDVPHRILAAAAGETHNPALAGRALASIDHLLPTERRFSYRHGGRRLLLDHVLMSPALAAGLRTAEVHNEALLDEIDDRGRAGYGLGSFHAPLVAEFEFAPG